MVDKIRDYTLTNSDKDKKIISINDIKKAWLNCYGEDLADEYHGFLQELTRQAIRPEFHPEAELVLWKEEDDISVLDFVDDDAGQIYIEIEKNGLSVMRYVASHNEITLVEWENVTENNYPFYCNADEELGESVEHATLEDAKAYAMKYINKLKQDVIPGVDSNDKYHTLKQNEVA